MVNYRIFLLPLNLLFLIFVIMSSYSSSCLIHPFGNSLRHVFFYLIYLSVLFCHTVSSSSFFSSCYHPIILLCLFTHSQFFSSFLYFFHSLYSLLLHPHFLLLPFLLASSISSLFFHHIFLPSYSCHMSFTPSSSSLSSESSS